MLATWCTAEHCVPAAYSSGDLMALSSFLQAGEPQQGGWSALFHGKYRRIMVLASALPILQQLSGINTVVFYSSDVSPLLGSFAVWGSCNAHVVSASSYGPAQSFLRCFGYSCLNSR